MTKKMDESTNLDEKDTISHRKFLIKTEINNIREKRDILGSRILKNKKKSIRKKIRLDERISDEDNELEDSDIEHINRGLNFLEKYLLKESRYYYHDTKYKRIDDLRNLFDEDEDEDEDYYDPKLINTAFKNNYSQYQTTSDRKNILPPSEYFKIIEPGLIKLINKHKKDNWKIQLTMKIIFTPIEDFNDKRALYLKTKNVEIMMGSDTNEIVKELFESIIQKYQELMEYSTKNSGLILEGVELMNYDINKITINRGGSYIESPTWLKSKKCTINPQNKNDNNCFQYALAVALNYEKINNHPEKVKTYTLH